MKKKYRLFALVLLLISMLFVFAACNNPVVNEDPDPPAPEPQEPEEILPVNVEIDLAADDILEGYDSYHEFVCHEDGQWLIITVDQDVQDFGIISVDFYVEEDDVFFIEDEVLFTLEELTPDEPLLLKLTMFGAIPSNGLRYTDTDESVKHYTISMSGQGEDEGPLYLLIEFEN